MRSCRATPGLSGWRGSGRNGTCAEGIRVFTKYFGARPEGCWPAEGAVNDAETLRLH
jgi:hypothetical protein